MSGGGACVGPVGRPPAELPAELLLVIVVKRHACHHLNIVVCICQSLHQACMFIVAPAPAGGNGTNPAAPYKQLEAISVDLSAFPNCNFFRVEVKVMNVSLQGR